jgi:hypothetical protein
MVACIQSSALSLSAVLPVLFRNFTYVNRILTSGSQTSSLGSALSTAPAALEMRSYQNDATTDGQSASSLLDTNPDACYCQTTASSSLWGALSGQPIGLSFTTAVGLRQRSHFVVRVPRHSWPYYSLSVQRCSSGRGT